jgi:hypothetical protein
MIHAFKVLSAEAVNLALSLDQDLGDFFFALPNQFLIEQVDFNGFQEGSQLLVQFSLCIDQSMPLTFHR